MLELEEIKARVKARLSDKRFVHTLGVADEAKRLALKWGADENDAYLAGIIHDYAKEIPETESVKLLTAFGFELTDELLYCPALLHGPLAAFLAERDFGVQDASVLNAVRYHTTGRADMSLLEKIIYLADFIEPNRHFDGVETARTLAYENLDRAVLAEADMVMVFNIERHVFLHSDTVKARNFLLHHLDSANQAF